ncbi:MAG: peptide chain release factor N(5)-glutamine methyltransferase [Coriobacteriia bacterium]|nr:peptide chain release factor N(5)-glutamine methyltransferase [Coriobacteriia bacterium]
MTDRVWTIKDALDWTTEFLAQKGDEHPRRSSEYLLSYATGLSRIRVYAFFDRPLTQDERDILHEAVAKRALGAPLQYVTGEVAFRHIILSVGPGVLIPRPETEVLVDIALDLIKDITEPKVLDVGTGSGCIALSIAHENPRATVVATDISPEALEVARKNADALGLSDRVTFLEGNLASSAFDQGESFNLLVSNPPYIPSATLADLEKEVVSHEPVLALDGGEDGLDVYRELLEQIVDFSRNHVPFSAVFELDERNVAQARDVALKSSAYSRVTVRPDLTKRDRFLVCVP